MNLFSADHISLEFQFLAGITVSAILAFLSFAVQGVPTDPLLIQGGIELMLASVFVILPVIQYLFFQKVTLLASCPILVPQSITRQRLLPIIS